MVVPPVRWLDESGLMACTKDGAGRYRFANQRFRDVFGTPPPGGGDRDLFSPATADRFAEHEREVLAAGQPTAIEEILSIKGEERGFLFLRFPLKDAEAALGVLAIEVAGRPRIPPTDSHALFEAILDIAVDAIVSVDERQRIVLFNQGAERIFGYSAAEVLGQDLVLLLPEAARATHGRHVSGFSRAPERARPMGSRGGIAGRRKDGTIFPAEASISRVDQDGRLIFTAILRDTTAQREAENAIEKLNADLEARATQLEAANRELEAFSYSVSHDLRAPLRAIDGFSQVLAEDFENQLPAEAQDSLKRIRAASQRMSQLIDDMLTLSRLTRGDIKKREVDLSALAQAIARDLLTAEPERRVHFDIEDGIMASADPPLIQAVLTNLLENAWKFTGKQPSARIAFGRFADRHGRLVHFVKDDGAGFDMAYAGKLFGAFQRLHGMAEYPGTGIGLATVQRIIHKHGGEVWAEGTVNQGATFYFTLS